MPYESLGSLKCLKWLPGTVHAELAAELLADNHGFGERGVIKMYGKTYPFPRDQIMVRLPGGTNIPEYRYSGYDVPSRDATATEVKMFEVVRAAYRLHCQQEFPAGYLLLNRYQNGQDGVGWHADDETHIDQRYGIISLSVGTERDFLVRTKDGRHKWKIPLGNGDVAIMKAGMQATHHHCLPKRKNAHGTRLNYTFRVFKGAR